ncbi:MAG: hypothetical protein JNM56_30205 [Planctomycetia bacterium]|nr:hypothetical protein [Planctomycetia bacterium]
MSQIPNQPGVPGAYPAPPAAPVIVQRPVYVQSPPAAAPPSKAELRKEAEQTPQLTIISHSPLLYWWPIWAVGYILAAMTYFQGQPYQIGQVTERIHPSSNIGVLFFVTLFLVVLITNVSVRGLASGMVVLSILLLTVLFAYLDWWDPILAWAGNLSIHMNLGGYVFISTLMFLAWFLAVFVFDRMSYWRIKPGQITQEFVFGAGSRSYDTQGIVVEKHRDDVFRHWILGAGSGDLVIRTSGANRDTIQVPNVAFIGSKIDVLQRMIATEPDAFSQVKIT